MPVAKKVRVGIIGSGFSGLAAARYILKNYEGEAGLEVIVLEGRDRVGGRAVSVDITPGVPVDLGPSWIHGIQNNPIYKFAQDTNVEVVDDAGDRRTFIDSSSGDIVDDAHAQKAKEVVAKIYNAARYFGSQTEDFSIPLESTFFTYLNNYRPELKDVIANPEAPALENTEIKEESEKKESEQKENKEEKESEQKETKEEGESTNAPTAAQLHPEVEIRERIVVFYLLLEQLITAARLNEISSMGWSKYREFEGAQGMFKHGYKSVVDSLAHTVFGDGYPCSNSHSLPLSRTATLSLSSAVNSIEYENADKVTVSTKNGEKYEFDHIIVTVPLGVLKSKQISFSPPLLVFKQAAIDNLGFGVTNKIILKFDVKFWPSHFICCLPTTEFGNEFLSFVSLYEINGTMALISFVHGQFAKVLERMDKSKVQDLIMKRLKDMFPQTCVDPTHMEMSKWFSDEFSRGAYSFPQVNGGFRDIVNLTEPIQTRFGVPRVMFAGEATDEVYYGTTHAAFMSGEREGKRLLDALAKETKRLAEQQ